MSSHQSFLTNRKAQQLCFDGFTDSRKYLSYVSTHPYIEEIILSGIYLVQF